MPRFVAGRQLTPKRLPFALTARLAPNFTRYIAKMALVGRALAKGCANYMHRLQAILQSASGERIGFRRFGADGQQPG